MPKPPPARLAALLASIFPEAEALRRWLRAEEATEALATNLPSAPASHAQVTEAAARQLIGLGLANPPFFQRLTQHAPGRTEEIEALQASLPRPASAADPRSFNRYRRRVIRQCERLHEGFDGTPYRRLSRIWVRLRVKPDPRGGPSRDPALSEPRPLEDFLAREGRRLVVLGDPGSGKSTLLRRVAIELCRGEGRLPLLLKIPSLMAKLDEHGEVEVALEACVRDAALRKDAPAVLEAVRRGGVVLLDGLDEVLDPDTAHARLPDFVDALDDATVVIACRPQGYKARTLPWDYQELVIEPLGPREQVELLSRFVPKATAAESLATLNSRPRMAELAGNPLLLSLVGLVLKAGDELPDRRSKLYRKAIGHRLDPRQVDSDPRREPLADEERAREALQWLSLKLHGEARAVKPSSTDSDAVSMGQVLAALEEHPGDLADQVDDIYGGAWKLLGEVQRVSGLVELRGFPGDMHATVLFRHRSFREFLAAEALERDLIGQGLLEVDGPEVPGGFLVEDRTGPSADIRGELVRILRDSKERPAQWSEVLALCCGLLEGGRADRLVTLLARDGNRRLVARVVAEGEGLSPGTVEDALGLESGYDKWEERRDLLEKLPELLGDLDAVVGLVERWLGETTDGNDLWWGRERLRRWGEALESDDEGASRARARARRVAEGLFAGHQVEEREELARMMETLWVTVPPEGEPLRFMMGSPDKVGDGYEHPQHEVRFTQRFAVMSVPVTWAMYRLFDPSHDEEARDSFGGELTVAEQEKHPVYRVTWYAARAFAEWLGHHDLAEGARLPLEAEWEFVCRAGTTGPWSFDEATQTLADVANVADASLKRKNSHYSWAEDWDDGFPYTSPVRSFAPNPWGLYDVHGNVREWCRDAWDSEAYAKRRDGVPVDPETASFAVGGGEMEPDAANLAEADAGRVVRGGCWDYSADWARSAFRSSWVPAYRFRFQGFRLVLPHPQDG